MMGWKPSATKSNISKREASLYGIIPRREENDMDIFKTAETENGLSNDEIAKLLEQALADWESRRGAVRNALIIPPDFTRFHSNAGYITQVFYRLLTAKGAAVDILPALGTHVPVSETQWKTMFGDIPYDKMLVHNWRTDVVRLGEVTAA